jgi:hypothetical protein
MNVLERRVLELISEDPSSPDVFTDDSTGMAQIRDSLNDAIQEVCMLTGSHRRKFYIPLEEDVNFYQVTSDRDYFAYPLSIWLTGIKRRLIQVDLPYLLNLNYRWLYDTGNPLRYFLIGADKIGVHPRPAADSYSLEIDAVAIPDVYTLDTDRIKIRDEYQWAIVNYAVSEYWASVGDAISATDYFARYLRRLGMMGLYPYANERQRSFETVKDDLEQPKNQT